MEYDAAYRERVVEIFKKVEFPKITDAEPIVSAIHYHHLGIAVSSIPDSMSFYRKVGFTNLNSESPSTSNEENIVKLKSANGLEIHLIQAQEPLRDNNNLLMDFPTSKAPGHTHASWSIASVPKCRQYFEDNGIAISGTRSTLSIFIRDLDRTTLEFERNDGGDSFDDFIPDTIGEGRTLDHVGIRIRAPYERHLRWYSEILGFTTLVSKYEEDLDPLKNFRPWITRSSSSHCDINFIINCNTPVPELGEGTENVLFTGGILRPGIIYAAFQIDSSDVAASFAALQSAGVDAILDTSLADQPWGDFPRGAVAVDAAKPTILLRDLNGTVIRLVPS